MKNHLVQAQTDWSNGKFFKEEITQEQWLRLRALGCGLEDFEKREHIYTVEFLGSMSELATINEEFPNLNWTIKKVRGIQYDADFDVHRLSNGVIDQVDRSQPQINNISVSGTSLLSIRSLTWIEDACTNEVQGYLDKGWKIVAVCPPNDSRRPTYILGHIAENQSL